MTQAAQRKARLATPRDADPYPPDWFIEDDEKVPTSRPHTLNEDRLVALLLGWKQRTGRDVQVGRELAMRWDKRFPKVGIDPDVYVVEPPPPEGDAVTCIKTWQPGHHPPRLAIEIVSRTRPDKDYSASPKKCDLLGVEELWIFDPQLAGPKAGGGPFRLQKWRRDPAGGLARVYAGEGPMYSEELDAWAHAVDDGRRLAIAGDQEGTRWWMTPEEAALAAKETERAAKEAALAAKETERAAKEAALARIAELEALLARK